jgi:glutamate carboxypeptidase
MQTTATPFDSATILDDLGVDGQGAHTHCEQIYISSIEPGALLLHRLYQTLR